MATKDRYRELCEQEATIPIFSRDWWLDAVCGADNWGVALVEKGAQVVGALPYFQRRRRGSTVLVQPPLTQKLGPWIRPSNAKYAKRLGHEKDIMAELIDQLPTFSLFSQNWHHANTNWLPFFWHGFSQTTRYTYIVDDLKDEERLWGGLADKIRTDIRKASNRSRLIVRDDLDLDAMLALNRKTFARQNKLLPYSEQLVRRIDQACAARGCRKLLIAVDDQGRHHAGAYIVWDTQCAYYLIGGGDPDLRNSGATSLVLWQAMLDCASVTQAFDFEGSMIESIERFFRGFGARQTPFFTVRKERALMVRLASCYRSLRGKS